MALLRLFDLTWSEVENLDRSRTIAVLPVGAIEAHGPHLPLGTDAIIAEAMAESGAERLVRAGYDVLMLPTMTYTAARFGAGFAGTVSLDGEAVSATIVGIARSLAAHGIQVLALANSHLDPVHLQSLNTAVNGVRKEARLQVIFPDITKKPWASRLTEEFKSGACHAGQYETSIVLAKRPQLVHDELRRELPPNPVSLSAAIREGKATFSEAGGPQAYFGNPAEASSEEGKNTIEILGAILEEAIIADIST